MAKEDKGKKALIILPIFGGLGALLYFLFRRRPPTPPPDKAILYGKIIDAETTSPIPGIQVTVDGYAGVSDSKGNYLVENIEPSTYPVSFTDPQGQYQSVII